MKTKGKCLIAVALVCVVAGVVTACRNATSKSLESAEEEFMRNMASKGNFRVMARQAIGREIIEYRILRKTWPTKSELIDVGSIIEFTYMKDSKTFRGTLTEGDYDFHIVSESDEEADYSIKLGDTPARTITHNINWL